SSTDSDGGIPLSVRVASRPSNGKNGGGSDGSSSDSDNVPLSIRSKRQPASAPSGSDSGTESDEPLSGRVKAPRKKAVANGNAPAPKRTKKALTPKVTKKPRTAAS
ncbi:hypothetical protein GGI13_008039, partial [Coemansia sp. RSA 455]